MDEIDSIGVGVLVERARRAASGTQRDPLGGRVYATRRGDACITRAGQEAGFVFQGHCRLKR